jgi:MFS family permease
MNLELTPAADIVAESAGEQAGPVWALILLTLVYGLSIVDRSIFGLLLQPIKQEFRFSDTMLGLIGSVGFAFTYAFAGLPLSRLADRLNRKNVVALGLAKPPSCLRRPRLFPTIIRKRAAPARWGFSAPGRRSQPCSVSASPAWSASPSDGAALTCRSECSGLFWR